MDTNLLKKIYHRVSGFSGENAGNLSPSIYLQKIRDLYLGTSSLGYGSLEETIYLQQIRDALLGTVTAQYGNLEITQYLREIIEILGGGSLFGAGGLDQDVYLREMLSLCSQSGYFLPKNLIVSPGSLLEDFESITNWTIVNGSIAIDPLHVKSGANSLALTGVSGSFGRIKKITGINWDVSGGLSGSFRFWIYINDSTKITANSARIILANDIALTQTITYFHPIRTGWNLISVSQSDWVLAGGFSWIAPVLAIQVQFTDAAAQIAVCSYDELLVGVVTQPALMICFDDGFDSAYTYGYKYLQSHKINSTHYIITDLIDTAFGGQRMTREMLLEMSRTGSAICNHTDDHTSLSGLTQAEQESHINNAKVALDGLGIGKDALHVAFPFGDSDANTLLALSNLGYRTGRRASVDSFYHMLPFQDSYQIPLGKNFGNTLSFSQAAAWLDTVISRKEIGIALFHKLVGGVPATTSEWNIIDFRAFVDYVVSTGIACITMPQAYELMSGEIRIPQRPV